MVQHLSIKYKLLLAFLAATIFVVAAMFFFIQWSFDRGFASYVNSSENSRADNLLKRLEDHYARHGSWDRLTENRQEWLRLHRLSGVIGQETSTRHPPPPPPRKGRHGEHIYPPPRHERPPPRRRSGGNSPGNFGRRLLLFDKNNQRLIGAPELVSRAQLQKIRYRKEIVGYLGVVPVQGLENMHDVSFVADQTESFALIAVLVFLISALASLPLAWRLTAPVQKLANAVRDLAAGNYKTHVNVHSRDELGRLSHDVNMLAKTLHENEQARKQWIADVSHELRTPLAVLQGEIEALQDGVRQPNTQSLNSLHTEVKHLGSLVGDLYELSMSDIGALSYKKDNLDLVELLERTISGFLDFYQAQNIKIEAKYSVDDCEFLGDAQRLQQLFGNLLKNTLRYTDAGGQLNIELTLQPEFVVIDFQDSEPGVDEKALPLLFERLYRTESSRNRNTGGAGLGLAICHNIVDAHEGAINAMPSPLGGLWIRVKLPRTY